MAAFYPPINSWYQDLSTSQLFEIVAIDENSGTIEVQFQDGDIDEYDIETWGQLKLIQTQTPDEDSAAYTDDSSDLWDNDSGFDSNEFMSPLDMIEPDSFQGFDEL